MIDRVLNSIFGKPKPQQRTSQLTPPQHELPIKPEVPRQRLEELRDRAERKRSR